MNKKVVLAGGTGYIGQYLQKQFTKLNDDVNIISRQASYISWNDEAGIREALENSDMLINLAGKSVDCRYTAKNKQKILRSRIDTTNILGNIILTCQNPPLTWFNASTATVYRASEDKSMGEESGEIGGGFSVYVGKEWESAFFDFELTNTRQVALRIAIVLGKDGGVMGPFKNIVKYGLGGSQGSGRQRFSWIHIEDLFNIIIFLNEQKTLNGVINCTSPYPVTNKELMKQLRKVMGVKVGLPSPKWLLEIGAILINTETELILKSWYVIPERLLQSEFKFRYEKLNEALSDIIN